MAITRQKQPFSINNFSVKLNIGGTVDTNFWSKCSKIGKTWENGDYSDGQTNIIYKLPGAVRYPDVTLSKPFNDENAPLVKALLAANANKQYVEAFIQPMYRDGYYSQNIGGQIILQFCTVVDCSIINEIDTGGSSPVMMDLILAPGYITSQGSTIWWEEPTTTTA